MVRGKKYKPHCPRSGKCEACPLDECKALPADLLAMQRCDPLPLQNAPIVDGIKGEYQQPYTQLRKTKKRVYRPDD